MRIVLDTNVLVSGLLNPEGTPAQILNLLINGKLVLLYDSRILKEYEEVLHRRKFGFRPTQTGPLLDYFGKEGEYISAEPSREPFRDEDDRMFYEVAVTGKAVCLVTGNKDHYPKGKIVRSPKEALELYLAGNEEKPIEAT